MASSRSGLLAGGNFIVDYVKIVSHLPAENMLALISSETMANGGGPYNVLKDLAAMLAEFPLQAAGMVGSDANGEWIAQDCRSHGIDAAQLHSTPLAPTSYTDAMTVRSTGRRTFFHQPGANTLLAPEHFDFSATSARLFHLGYLTLLETLDSVDETTGRTRAAQVLEQAKAAGLETSVDLVSGEHVRFREIALDALPFTDHLVLNEVEVGKILGRTVSEHDLPAVRAAAEEMLAMGVGKSVVIHFENGAVAAARGAETLMHGSLELPEGFSAGATGAGDAFAAGYLYGVHEEWPMFERLDLAVCAAAASLTHPSPSGGLRPVQECFDLGREYPRRVFA